jgi:WD40 repeat protein
VRLWNAADGNLIREFINPNLKAPPPPVVAPPPAAHPLAVYAVRFTPDGKYLLSAGAAGRNQGYLAIWSVADGKLAYAEELPVGGIWGLALSPDAKLLALGTNLAIGPERNKVNASFVIKMPEIK